MSVTWPPYLHASCSWAGKVLVRLYLGALVVHGIPSAAHGRFACGFILLQAGFFSPQKKTKLDCDKYVAPNKNMQHLLSSFIWRSYTVNYIGYAITLCFNYTALARGRSASLNLVMEQGANRKKGIWCNSSLQTNAVSVRPGRGRKNLISHVNNYRKAVLKSKITVRSFKHKRLFFFHTWRKGFAFNVYRQVLSSFYCTSHYKCGWEEKLSITVRLSQKILDEVLDSPKSTAKLLRTQTDRNLGFVLLC